MAKLETVAVYSDHSAAIVAKSRLEAEGFFVVSPELNVGDHHSRILLSMQRIRLMTVDEQAADVRAILSAVEPVVPKDSPQTFAAVAPLAVMLKALGSFFQFLFNRFSRLFRR